MEDGVDIGENEFKKMNQKDQNLILYQNTRDIKKFLKMHTEAFEKHIKDDKFNFKIIHASIGILTLVFGITKYFNLL